MVTIAFWVFVLAAVGHVFYGVLALTVVPAGVRSDLRSDGAGRERIDLIVQALTVLGFVLTLGGVLIGFLAAGVRRGDVRARRALVALCVPLVVIGLGGVYLRLGVTILLPVVLIVGAVMILRPSAEDWFAGPGRSSGTPASS